MLPETEKILPKFRDLNRKHFYEIARDFVPAAPFGHHEGSYYGHFDEVEEIYSLMYTLHLQLDDQLFFGHYDNAYASPIEPIMKLQELNVYLKGHIERLQELNNKYNNHLIPVKGTLDCYLMTQQTIEHVLSLTEIINVIGNSEKELLKSEIVGIKTEQAYRKKRTKVLLQFAFYTLCLFVPLILIVILWDKHQNGKWFQLGLFLFPVISFLYDKNAFLGIFKFILFKKERKKIKEEANSEILQNYR
jgi:hypothetical protein